MLDLEFSHHENQILVQRLANDTAERFGMRNLPKNYKDLLDPKYRWPTKGDRLLRTTNWDAGASFAPHALSRHVHIWSGYFSAGEALVEDCRRNPQERHFLIYPILFTYRHGLELAMKWILTMYGGHTVNEISHHDLWQLWKLTRQVTKIAGDTSDATDVVEAIVKEMHDLDKSALAFRYGIDRSNNPPRLPEGTFDLENIRDVMTGVSHFFEGTDGWLSDHSNARP